MKVLQALQRDLIADAVLAKFSIAVPVLTALLNSLSLDRQRRLGGQGAISLWDLAREWRENPGDSGLCFELAIHEAIANRDPGVQPLVSQVLNDFCGIRAEAESILFGPEKNHVIPILETVQDALTDDSTVYVGNRGRPPKLKRYIPKIIRAFRRNEDRNNLPRSISGLWKADLFIGGKAPDAWVGTTVKINPRALQGAQGLRVAIYPVQNDRDGPRLDENLNLVRLPLPYDGQFMELFYKTFNLVRAFLRNDARVPSREDLPDAADRYITQELEARREFPILRVIEVIRAMGQPALIDEEPVEEIQPDASLSEAEGLGDRPAPADTAEFVSLAPKMIQI